MSTPSTPTDQLDRILDDFGLCKCGRAKDSPNFAYHVCIEQGLRFRLHKALEAREADPNGIAALHHRLHEASMYDRVLMDDKRTPQEIYSDLVKWSGEEIRELERLIELSTPHKTKEEA